MKTNTKIMLIRYPRKVMVKKEKNTKTIQMKMAKFDSRHFLMYILNIYIYVVCAKYQKASVKDVVTLQAGFPVTIYAQAKSLFKSK